MIDLILPSPIEHVDHPVLKLHEVTLDVKREDLIHPLVSGNKWRKLKYNLYINPKGIITFGGAFSNHIHATAAACHVFKIPSVGIIRGEEDISNPTLRDARDMGMQLYYVSRSAYRLKEESADIQSIINQYPDYTPIPEGGSNDTALLGVHELGEEIAETVYDVVALAAGTGATARGILPYCQDKEVILFSAIKTPDLYHAHGISPHSNILLTDDYALGGYGKTTPQFIHWINKFSSDTGIPVDPIYNGKVIHGLMDMIRSGRLHGKRILWIHTGGLQGIAAYNYMAAKKNKPLIV